MPQFVYISAAHSNEIFVLRMDADTGELSAPLQATSLSAVTGRNASTKDIESVPLAISPKHRYLYAALRYEPFTIVSFTIDPTTGLLTPLATGPSAHSMSFIATDKSGRFLLGASYPGNLLSINPIGLCGVVDEKPSQIVPFKQNAHSVMTDGDNRHVYAAILGQDRIMGLPFDSVSGRFATDAELSIQLAPGLGPRHFGFHPSGRFLYANTEQGGTVHAFSFDAKAQRWIEIQAASAMPPGFFGTASAADLHISPDGRFLYTSERTDSTIVCFAIDGESGALSYSGRFLTEKKPRSFAIDPAGRFLLAVGQLSHHASIYAIDGESGALTLRDRYPMGRNPGWVEIVTLPE